MLSVFFPYGTHQDLVIHVGQHQRVPWKGYSFIIRVQADSDELEWIRANLAVPVPRNNRVVSWFGDVAKYIAANWEG